MELSDLFVSYKLVRVPKRELIVEEIPTNKYLNMLLFVDNKTSETSETLEIPKQSDTTDEYGFPGWAPLLTSEQPIATVVGSLEFEKAYNEVEKTNSEAKKYRRFLTYMAKKESGFKKAVLNNKGAPAYGYFLFMLGKFNKRNYNNITHYAGTDIETFRNDPKLQIESAIKLAQSFEKGFSKEDIKKAKEKGFTTFGLLGGAWLSGNSGVSDYLHKGKNRNDKIDGVGTDVATRIKEFNF